MEKSLENALALLDSDVATALAMITELKESISKVEVLKICSSLLQHGLN